MHRETLFRNTLVYLIMEKRKLRFEEFDSNLREFRELSIPIMIQGEPSPIKPLTFEDKFGYKVFFDDMGYPYPDPNAIELI